MIKINLLPPELRKVHGKAPPVPYLPLAALGAGLFLLLTFFFYLDFLNAKTTHAKVYREWSRVSPLMGQLKTMETKIEIEMRGEKDFLEANILNTQPITRVLMRISEYLPLRGWLTSLKFERLGEGCRLVLDGVVLPAEGKTGIEHIEEFLQKLKTQFSQASLTLTTSKASSKNVADGTSFKAIFEWGAVKKP